MKNRFVNFKFSVNQRGATLIISMVLLAVVTMLGLASMRDSTLELKMAASSRSYANAFQAAESALTSVERIVNQNQYSNADFLTSCSGTRCFKSPCNKGLCFGGDIESAVTREDCQLANSTASKVIQFWNDSTIWDSADNVGTVNVVSIAGTPRSVSYLIEFMCFVPRTAGRSTDEDFGRNNGVPLFQITVRAKDETNRSTVMLQSTFRGSK